MALGGSRDKSRIKLETDLIRFRAQPPDGWIALFQRRSFGGSKALSSIFLMGANTGVEMNVSIQRRSSIFTAILLKTKSLPLPTRSVITLWGVSLFSSSICCGIMARKRKPSFRCISLLENLKKKPFVFLPLLIECSQ
ncbi:hypothetical protein NPIL_418721 [Nephila pilipes]|uniref:Uncharacterized protein n=1 Tax=Nephila pilipes TaxID=299642 RepID=A0A8X6MG02_NEPPI|nr:hypothetical protein NPIL_418721 [Nephila pilipes]